MRVTPGDIASMYGTDAAYAHEKRAVAQVQNAARLVCPSNSSVDDAIVVFDLKYYGLCASNVRLDTNHPYLGREAIEHYGERQRRPSRSRHQRQREELKW